MRKQNGVGVCRVVMRAERERGLSWKSVAIETICRRQWDEGEIFQDLIIINADMKFAAESNLTEHSLALLHVWQAMKQARDRCLQPPMLQENDLSAGSARDIDRASQRAWPLPTSSWPPLAARTQRPWQERSRQLASSTRPASTLHLRPSFRKKKKPRCPQQAVAFWRAGRAPPPHVCRSCGCGDESTELLGPRPSGTRL